MLQLSIEDSILALPGDATSMVEGSVPPENEASQKSDIAQRQECDLKRKRGRAEDATVRAEDLPSSYRESRISLSRHRSKRAAPGEQRTMEASIPGAEPLLTSRAPPHQRSHPLADDQQVMFAITQSGPNNETTVLDTDPEAMTDDEAPLQTPDSQPHADDVEMVADPLLDNGSSAPTANTGTGPSTAAASHLDRSGSRPTPDNSPAPSAQTCLTTLLMYQFDPELVPSILDRTMRIVGRDDVPFTNETFGGWRAAVNQALAELDLEASFFAHGSQASQLNANHLAGQSGTSSGYATNGDTMHEATSFG